MAKLGGCGNIFFIFCSNEALVRSIKYKGKSSPKTCTAERYCWGPGTRICFFLRMQDTRPWKLTACRNWRPREFSLLGILLGSSGICCCELVNDSGRQKCWKLHQSTMSIRLSLATNVTISSSLVVLTWTLFRSRLWHDGLRISEVAVFSDFQVCNNQCNKAQVKETCIQKRPHGTKF
jgi:hypothetical protein